MSKPIRVSASILCADFANLKDEIKRCEDAGIDMFHIDVMDGHFVPNITIGPIIVEALRPHTKLPIASHLMIENPSVYIDDFIKAGSDAVYVQTECYGRRRDFCRDYGQYPKEIESIDVKKAKEDIAKIKIQGAKAFMVLNPGTPNCLGPVLGNLDGVLVMSVNPGFAKQKFMPVALPKVQQLREQFDGDIEIDGGINEATAPEAVRAGANILATASYFFGSDDPPKAVQYLKSL